MRVSLPAPSRVSGRPNVWLSLACLLLWGCSTSGQTSVESGAPDQASAESRTSEEAGNEDRIGQHTAWMEGCSNSPVEFQQIDDLDIYATTVSPIEHDDVVSCLFSPNPDAWRIVVTPDRMGFIISTPFYTRRRLVLREEPPGFAYERGPGAAALIRTPDTIYVVQWNPPLGQRGIWRVLHVTDDAFLIRGERFSGERNYLFRASTGIGHYLSDGRIEIESAEDLIFRVERADATWKPFDFYYNAIIGEDGAILDVLPPSGDSTEFDRVCMSSGLFVSRTELDLTRVTNRKTICVLQ